MNRLRLLAFLSFAVLCARSAEAQGAFFDGGYQTTSTNCPVTGTAVDVLQVNTGYFTDLSSFPKTGDTVYVRSVGNNISPCVNDTVGFEFFLPDGASLAISQANPVLCQIGTFGNPPSENVVPNYGACLQTPQAGANGGLFFGYSALAPGYYVSFRVPVTFNKKLLGIAGPNSHRLTIAALSAYPPYTVFPFQPVTVFYETDFESFGSSSVTASAANLGFTLKSYFLAGTLFIDYGTTPSFGSSLPGASVPATDLSYPVSVSLSGLTASTLYYWRARYVTASGTFNSATQSFTTTGASAQLLTVNTGGLGSGTVTSSPPGISCSVSATCSASFSSGATVTLTATPGAGSSLAAWSGACSGTGACSVTMNSAQTVNASFMRDIGSLNVTLDGLPASTTVDLVITGPDGFNVTRTTMTGTGFGYSDVGTGLYTVTAPNTTVLGTPYAAPSQSGTVNFGLTSTINIVYTQQGTAPPTGVVAAATSPTSVTISWIGVKSLTYEVLRVGANGASSTIGSSLSGSITDNTALANTAYLYKVRAILPSASIYSAPDLATTVIFTDPTLTAGTTRVKAAHISELRTAINAVRALAALGASSFTDPTLTAGATAVKAAHVTELRNALANARMALTLSAATFTTPTLTAGLAISAAHINDLRTAVR